MVGRITACVVFLAGCGGDGGGGGDDGTNPDDAPYRLCVDKTNDLRASVGVGPVMRSAELEAFANDGAEYDFSRNPHDHFRDFSDGTAFAENECPHWDLGFGSGTVVGLVDACIDAFWSEGPGGGHYENMIGAYGALGCGIYHQGSDYTIIQDYGR